MNNFLTKHYNIILRVAEVFNQSIPSRIAESLFSFATFFILKKDNEQPKGKNFYQR